MAAGDDFSGLIYRFVPHLRFVATIGYGEAYFMKGQLFERSINLGNVRMG